MDHKQLTRRRFLEINMVTGAVCWSATHTCLAEPENTLIPTELIGGLKKESGESPLPNGVWYNASEPRQGLLYTFEKGRLAEADYLTFDLLADGEDLIVFMIHLREGEDGPAFTLHYKGLNQCQARVRFPLAATDMNRWRLEREAAWLKPICGGERVDLKEVDRLTLTIHRKSERPARWSQTPIRIMTEEPATLDDPILPKGKLLDEIGQSLIHEWPGRTKNVKELTQRLKTQYKTADHKNWPDFFSRWGGWKARKAEASGFFSTHHDGERWWLVDPDGHFFWSAGLDCVRAGIYTFREGLEKALTFLPDRQGDYKSIYGRQSIDYLVANFIRAFGPDKWYDHWERITLSLMKDFGFNTVANWSDWEIARRARFPYVRPLSSYFRRSKRIYRDFPDVFHPDFEKDAEDYAQQLLNTRDDPALIGYFLMNEPTWGFSREAPAAGMLFNTPQCETRKALSRFLSEKYGDNASLSKAWKIKTTFDAIAEGPWKTRLTTEANRDLFAFSEVMVERLFGTLSDTCKKADPNHLNLGIRYQGVPPEWTVPGMRNFDVFSMNCYRERVPADVCKRIGDMLKMPVVIGEYHFGALDVGLPSPGLVHVRSQEDRGKAYRYYLETAAAIPQCVGVHYFTLYDQSAMGRFDGENYNIGFLDVCNKPYEPLTNAARISHERMYSLAVGEVEPYNDPPDYLPRLF